MDAALYFISEGLGRSFIKYKSKYKYIVIVGTVYT